MASTTFDHPIKRTKLNCRIRIAQDDSLSSSMLEQAKKGKANPRFSALLFSYKALENDYAIACSEYRTDGMHVQDRTGQDRTDCLGQAIIELHPVSTVGHSARIGRGYLDDTFHQFPARVRLHRWDDAICLFQAFIRTRLSPNG